MIKKKSIRDRQGKFKIGDIVVINTTKYDTDPSDEPEFGKMGKVSRIDEHSVHVDFPEGVFKGGETFGSYNEDDLRHLNKLERALK